MNSPHNFHTIPGFPGRRRFAALIPSTNRQDSQKAISQPFVMNWAERF
jgi:hypothetical protein